MELISRDHIKVKELAENWENSIQKIGRLLVKTEKITDTYIDSMIRAVKEYGPYMVLMPGFALVHAEPSNQVIETSVAMMTLEKPVEFHSKNDPVSVLLCLACRDKLEHIDMLKRIAEKLMNEGMIGKIAQCESEEELYQLINNN